MEDHDNKVEDNVSFLAYRIQHYQRRLDRKKIDAIKTGAAFIILFAIVAAFGFMALIAYKINFIHTEFMLFLAYFLIAFGGIGLLGSFMPTTSSIIKPGKQFICLHCAEKAVIYWYERKYICEKCMYPALIGESGSADKKDCPYCGASAFVSDSYGEYLCPDCGVLLDSKGGMAEKNIKACPSCKNELPESAIFCIKCGKVFEYDFPDPMESGHEYDYDWVAGKSTRGLVIYAEALFEGIIRRAGTEIKTPKDLPKFALCMETAFYSVEDAMRDEKTALAAKKLLPLSDKAYSALLQKMAELFRKSEKKEDKDLMEMLDDYYNPHLDARQRIEEKLGDELEKTGSIGIWDEEMYQLPPLDKDLKEIPGGKLKRIEALEKEAQRFKDWVEASDRTK